MPSIHRVTMFKINSALNRATLLEAYKELPKTALKDGSPYILSLLAGENLSSEPRAQGYTIIAKSEFSSLEDMKFYDEECEGHKKIKSVAGPMHEGVCTVYFESVV